jgi:ABC-type Na+ efflux pump permease subunit
MPLVGIFPLVSMFLVTSIAVLRERTSGTLERLLSLPLTKIDILAGYGMAFAFVAAVQAAVVSLVAVRLFGLHSAGPIWLLVVMAVANAELGMALGLFLSAFAATEFQAVQFMPAFVLPQLLLCGLAAVVAVEGAADDVRLRRPKRCAHPPGTGQEVLDGSVGCRHGPRLGNPWPPPVVSVPAADAGRSDP